MKYLLILLLFVACSEQVIIIPDPITDIITTPDKMGVDINYVPEQTAEYIEPYDNCFCKETVEMSTWFNGVERLEVIVETPIGCVIEKPYWTPHVVYVYGPWDSLHKRTRIDCKPEAEWENYWYQHFTYDNEWFLCDYYVPYPFPQGDSHDNYNGPNNCLKE